MGEKDIEKVIWQCSKEFENITDKHDVWKTYKGEFTEADREAIREVIPSDSLIIVHHESTSKWYDEFMEKGIDTTIRPPEMRYGRLTGYPSGKILQTRIEEPGLYVVPPPLRFQSGVLIVIKPEELAISSEASNNCSTPECSLFSMRDGLVKGTNIPAKRVLGKYVWENKPKEYWKEGVHHSWNQHWVFKPNPKALADPEMKKIIDCISENHPDKHNELEWCGCDLKENEDREGTA